MTKQIIVSDNKFLLESKKLLKIVGEKTIVWYLVNFSAKKLVQTLWKKENYFCWSKMSETLLTSFVNTTLVDETDRQKNSGNFTNTTLKLRFL